jgi:uracil-DNA glycosylase
LVQSVPVTGEPVLSQVVLVGQAPGIREPATGRPFAWTAGKHMFRWFEQIAGLSEAEVRSRVYFAAVCRCFPGRGKHNGDRVPSLTEIENCRPWMQAEFEILKPRLVIAVGRLAIAQFVDPVPRLTDLIGTRLTVRRWKRRFDLIALPHPSGASPWPMIEPGKSLTRKAVELIAAHPAWQELRIRHGEHAGNRTQESRRHRK